MAAARKQKIEPVVDLDLGGAPPRALRARKNIEAAADEPEAEAPPARTRRPRATAAPLPKVKTVSQAYVKIQIEENANVPPTGMFVGLNGRGFLIMPGVPVAVPPGIIEILNNAVEKMAVLDPQTLQVLHYRDKMRYPYRVVA